MTPHASLLSRVRAIKGYERVTRDLGCVWFFLLAALVSWGVYVRLQTLRNFTLSGMANLLASLCIVVLYLSCSWLLLYRPFTGARTDGFLPSVTALIGSYLPWSLMLFAPDRDPAGQNLVSSLLLAIGTAGAVFVILHLGKSFSIVPQARRLVRRGPYSLVRHPLYLAEEVALLGCLIRFFSPPTLALFLTHCGLQITRIVFEENLLRRTLPDYDEYSRSTARLIPYIW